MNNIENNKLIAEFMGYPKIANDEDKRDYLEDCVKYHESWDWLMPVVEKIEKNKGLTVQIIGRSTSILRNGNGQSEAFNKCSEYLKQYPIREFGNDKLEGCYKAVIEFVIWSNIFKEDYYGEL
jgi:predicted metal-dependent hydrolase